MMQRNPSAFLCAAAATILRRPTTVAVPRSLTSAPRAPPPTRRPLFPAHRLALSTYSLDNYDTRPVDIKELPSAYYYVLDVPGLRAGDLTVELVPDGWLKVTGEHREEVETVGCIYHRKDRPMGQMEHSFSLPQDVDLRRVSAVCRDGVLTVTIGKLPSPVLVDFPRTIEVQS